jgi:hypothetical protein
MLKPLDQNTLVATVSFVVKLLPLKIFQTHWRQGFEDCKCIHWRQLSSGIFSVVCDEMGSSIYTTLLLHTEVRWYHEAEFWFVYSHCTQRCWYSVSTIPPSFHNVCVTLWLQRLAYRADIFTEANELSLSFQGTTIAVISARGNIESYLRKIEFWVDMRWKENATDCFPTLNEFWNELESQRNDDVLPDIMEHLRDETYRLRLKSIFHLW